MNLDVRLMMKLDFCALTLCVACCSFFCGYTRSDDGAWQNVPELPGRPMDGASTRHNVVLHKLPGTVRRPVRPPWPHLPRPPLPPHQTQADTVRLLHRVKDVDVEEHRERLKPTVSQEIEDVRIANEHFLRIRTTAGCRLPKPRVVHVKDFYSDPDKDYLPACTILHRCGDDTGCCDSDQYQCAPRSIQEVTLYFYTIRLQNQSGAVGFHNSVSKLLFTNHTECECRPINDIPQILLPQRKQVPQNEHSNRLPMALPLQSSSPTTTVASPDDSTVTVNPPHEIHDPLRCHSCPHPFARRWYEDGRCSCDCFEKHKPCLRIKRGRGILGDLQRRCVETQECHVPECEYGLYDVDSGRCPKRPDYLPKHLEQRRQHPHSHRWQFIERD